MCARHRCRRTPGHGRARRDDRRRRWARSARLEPGPRDLPGDRASRRGHEARHRQLLPRRRRRDHARARAAADHARALAEGRAPGHRPLHAREGRRRRLLSEADPARARRTTCRPREIEFPSGRTRGRGLPHRDRGGRLGGADGDDHVSPVAGPQRRRRPPGRAADRPRPAAGHRLRGRGARRRRGAACCWTSSATSASRRPRAAGASTSTSGSSRAGRSPTSATPRSRSAASSSGAFPDR